LIESNDIWLNKISWNKTLRGRDL